MHSRPAFLVWVIPVLSTVLLASDGKTSAAPAGEGATERTNERGVPALFSWGDVDGDGRLDLAAVGSDGSLQLLVDAGDGRFEDVTERVGLAEVGKAALAAWADYDGDGRLDLFVGARAGASRLFRNVGGDFVDWSAGSGLVAEGDVQSAQWLDHDGDGRLDLFVVTAEGNELRSSLYRGLEGGFFERAGLPLAGARLSGTDGPVVSTGAGGSAPAAPVAPAAPGTTGGRSRAAGRTVAGEVSVSGGPGGRIAVTPTITEVIPLLGSACATSVVDQATPGACIHASTTPALGKLYPLSANLFVAVGGNVGVGTTSPSARLHVAGTARMTDTLTLAPSGDQALDVSTGSIYKGGALFLHTKGGSFNTALGREALSSATTGFSNTASGYRALRNDTTGYFNTASGDGALEANTTGVANTAVGGDALTSNTTGAFNTAGGQGALDFNVSGDSNTAFGDVALFSTTGSQNTGIGNAALLGNTTGSRNTACGNGAGKNLTTGDDNIMIGNDGVAGDANRIRIGTAGTHTRTFVAGIRGVTTGVANAIPVLVDSTGQLGTVSSSRRFKQDIADMGDRTDRLLELRPVVFHYKQEQTLPDGSAVPLEYGLIAEEVAEVFPDLVVYDEEGQPFTVKYHLLSSMLLNELQKMHEESGEQARQVGELRSQMEELRSALAAVEARTAPTAVTPASR